MPAAVMDIEAPSSSEKQVTESVMEEVQSSAPNLLFEGESLFCADYLFYCHFINFCSHLQKFSCLTMKNIFYKWV